MEDHIKREGEDSPLEQRYTEREKEGILRELEKKIGILKTLMDLIDSVDIEETYDEVQEKFKNFLEDTHKKYPFAAKGLTRYLLLKEDVLFFDSLSLGVESLMEKWKKIQEVKDDTQAMLSELGLEEGEVVKTYITPFYIDIVVGKEYFKQKNGEEETAHHVTSSPYNVYSDKEDEEDLDTDITHERAHAFLENFLPPLNYPSGVLKSRFTELARARRDGKIEEVERGKKELLCTDPSAIVNLLHEEMVADVDSVIRFLHYRFFDAFHEKQMEVGFSTARDEIDRITEFLGEKAQEEQDEIIRVFSSVLKREVNEKFNRSACMMRKALFLGKYFKEDFTVLSLLILLKPTKFYHIEKILKPRIGKELYEGYNAFYEIVGESKLSLKGLRSLLRIKGGLHESHRFVLKTKITALSDEGGYLATDDIRELEDLHVYNQGIGELGEFLDVEKEEIEYHREIASRVFFYRWLWKNIKDDFKELPRFIKRFHEEDRRLFLIELEELFLGHVERYIENTFGKEEKIDEKFIKALPFWQVLVDLKLDAVAQKGLDAYENKITNLPDE